MNRQHSDEWETRRRQIHHVAAKLFFETGFERGTTREIARRVGLTQPALYYYVGSKEDLLAQISIEVADEFTRSVSAAIEGSNDPAERLRAVVAAFLRSMAEHQTGFALRFSELRSLPRPIFKELREREREFVAMIQFAVTEAQAAGALPPGDPRVVTLAIIGMLSWTFTWLDPKSDDLEILGDSLCSLIGLVDPSPRPRSTSR